MRPSKSIGFFLASVILFGLQYSMASKKSAGPFTSKEEIQYLSKEEQGPLNLTKSKDFVGNIARINAPAESQMVDVYLYSDIPTKKLDEATCLKMAERVFGPTAKISFKQSGVVIEHTPRSGMICEITLKDDDSKAKFPERYFFARLVNEKAYGFVFKSKARSPAAAVMEEAKAFIVELR